MRTLIIKTAKTVHKAGQHAQHPLAKQLTGNTQCLEYATHHAVNKQITSRSMMLLGALLYSAKHNKQATITGALKRHRWVLGHSTET